MMIPCGFKCIPSIFLPLRKPEARSVPRSAIVSGLKKQSMNFLFAMCPQSHQHRQHLHQTNCHPWFHQNLGSGGETDPTRVGRMASMAADVWVSLHMLINMMIRWSLSSLFILISDKMMYWTGYDTDYLHPPYIFLIHNHTANVIDCTFGSVKVTGLNCSMYCSKLLIETPCAQYNT